MPEDLTKQFIEQLDSIADDYKQFLDRRKLKGRSSGDTYFVRTRALAAIERASGSQSVYCEQARDVIKGDPWGALTEVIGVARSLRQDLAAGYLASAEELIHAALFADFLEIAHHLLEQGYKDAAAVLAGGTLEGHLRQLCAKFNVDTEVGTPPRPKKAEHMNADLAKAGAYTKLDQKSVTAWLDLRNDAAHKHYEKYSKEQVVLFVAWLRDFITRNPA